MIYGNQQAQQSLNTIIRSVLVDWKSPAWFVILAWHSNIGKTSAVEHIAKDVLWAYYVQDFFYVPDFSRQLGKTHTMKIGTTWSWPATIQLPDGQVYNDIGMRDVVYRLQKSSANGKKILLLENIERMTNAAANAFLKAAEEPLPGTVIVATVTHKSQVMETILSRAITIPFQNLTLQEMEQYSNGQWLVFKNDQIKDLFLSMAMWRPWILSDLMNNIDDDVQQLFLDAMQSLQSQQSIQSQYTALMKLQKIWYLQLFLDAWIQKNSQIDPEKSQSRLSLKKQIQTNVSIDRLLLRTVIS